MYRIYDRRDPSTIRAQKEGYPARSVYKLKEINERYKLFRKGDFVLDLGSVPGSWLLFVAKVIGDNGKVVGVDKSEMKTVLPKNAGFLHKDVTELETKELPVKKFNAVISDMAPATSGIKFVDVGRSLELCEKALEVAQKVLKPNGNFICKIFENENMQDFLEETRRNFESVKFFRPIAVSKGSKEIYIVAKGFRKQI